MKLDELRWYWSYYVQNDCLPSRTAIARYRGVKQCGWPKYLLNAGYVTFNAEGRLMFTEKGREVVRADIIKDIGEVLEKYV